MEGSSRCQKGGQEGFFLLYCTDDPFIYNLFMPNTFAIHPLKHSSIYIGYLVFIHFFAFACAVMVLSIVLHVIILFLLIISFLFFLERHQEIISLEYARETEWILHCHDDRIFRMKLLPSSVMMRYFLILHFSEPGALATGKNKYATKTLVLFSDQFSPDNYRHLRRCVKMGFL